MTKMIAVRTTGPFMLMDRVSRAEIFQNTTKPVPHTSFIDERLKTKELELIDGEPEPEPEPEEVKVTIDVPDEDTPDEVVEQIVKDVAKSSRGRRRK